MSEASPKKILFILPALTAGGAERVMITLMNGLDRDKFIPIFLTVSQKGDLRDLIDPQIPFNALDSSKVLYSIPKLYLKIRDIRPDIVISTMAHMNFAVLSLKVMFPQTKFIVREAITPSFLFNKYKSSVFIIKALYKFLYPRADTVLSPSQVIFDEFRDVLRMDSKNFRVLPNPVDVERINNNPLHNIPVTKERKRTVHFLAAGRLGRQKGFDRLIEYLPTMNLPYDWHLTIIGEGPERGNLEHLIKKHNFTDNITLPGLVRPPWKHYMMADCFLMSSRFEGLPNVVLESLACGTPVIATEESGGIQYVADLAPKNSVNLAKDMNEFIKHMEKVKPKPHKKKKTCLLPDMFKQEYVFSQFEMLIEQLYLSNKAS